MWCAICKKNIIDCICEDIEERLKGLGPTMEIAAKQNLLARKMKKLIIENKDKE